MGRWKLCFLLLLPFIFYIDSQETQLLVKTIGREPDATPICANDTQHELIMIICRITTERSGGEECKLTYKYGQDFNNSCDSRFTLMAENRTVFLHLTSLTPEDSGNYSCECANFGGTFKLHINITVEDDEENKKDEELSSSTEILIPCALTGAAVVIITGAILGFIHKTKRVRSWSITSGLSVNETPGSVDQEDPDEPYMSLQQPTDELYETISSIQRQRDTNMTRSGSNV